MTEDTVPDRRLPEDLAKLFPDPALLKKPEGLEVAAYTFPNFHASALHDRLYAKGWTEYTIARGCTPWFEGHQQPRTPLLGELDESKPETWETYNTLAKAHGVDVLIWDWYWFDGGPQLHEALEQGFLKSKNRQDVKFCCMWTNQNWFILFPSLRTDDTVAYPPGMPAPDNDLEEAEKSLRYIVDRYFDEPNYWKIDGKPVLCVYEVSSLEKRLGLATAKALLDRVETYAISKGHLGIHLHCSHFYTPNQKEMGFTTTGSYTPMIAAAMGRPRTEEIIDYGTLAVDVVTKYWEGNHREFNMPYIPAVGMGWDSSSRFVRPFERPAEPNRDIWPRSFIVQGETPAAFKAFVQAAFGYLNSHPEVPRILTIACWNEWSECHYMLPDTRFGYGMLQALAEALGIDGTFEKVGKGEL